MTWPGVVLWVLIAWAAASRGPLIIYLFSGTLIFGSLTMLPPELSGGFNVLPQTICAIVLLAKIFSRSAARQAAFRLAFDVNKLGFLTFFWVYAMLTAFLLPRMLAGTVQVVTLNEAYAGPQALGPSSGNVSQSVYLSVSMTALFAFAVAGRDAVFRRHLLQSFLLTGILFFAAGLTDLLAGAAGQEAVLAPFRNATYSLLVDTSYAGQKRLVGFDSEASAFGSACSTITGLLYFCRGSFEPWARRWVLPLTLVGTGVMAFLSTSSAAIVAMGVIIGIILVQQIGRVASTAVTGVRRNRALAILAGAALAVFAFVYVLPDAISGPVIHLVNVTVFQKNQTFSYVERNSFNTAAEATFWGSSGIGVGIGALRTSNWYLNILASTGVVGSVALALGLARVFLGSTAQRSPEIDRLAAGLKMAILPIAVLLDLGGATPDPGNFGTALLGTVASLTMVGQPVFANLRQSRFQST